MCGDYGKASGIDGDGNAVLFAVKIFALPADNAVSAENEVLAELNGFSGDTEIFLYSDRTEFSRMQARDIFKKFIHPQTSRK
jgi:hypothetical protein